MNVHIRGGSKDLASHLRGLTMRVAVVAELIRLLRGSGYPGYEENGLNSVSSVAQRLKERYSDVYGDAAFIPAAIRACVNVKKMDRISIAQDKIATPSEPRRSLSGNGSPPYVLTTLSPSGV